MAVIEFRTLGTLDLRRADGSELHSLLAQPKRIALLAYLCLAKPRGFHRRDTLLGLFWPDADQTHARTSLRNALHVLRHSLGEAALHSRGDEEVAINFDVIWCDAVGFDERVALNDVDGGLDLYRGDLLTGFFLDDVPSFEHWLDSERTRLRRSAAQAARVAAERREAEGNLTEAVSMARRAVDLAATDERAVRGLIELLARVGDRAGALHAYENFAQHLTAEFGAEPSAETRELMGRVRSHERAAASVDSSPTGTQVEFDMRSQPSSDTNSGSYVTRPGGPRATRIAVAIGSAIIVTVAILVLAHGTFRPAYARHRVAVVPFQNLTGRSDLDFIGNLAADQVVADLGRNNLGEVVEGDR
ncbi:MAG: AfsR/SARP family transcriptional regulator, partial [Gemmatimonadaceae bacterium]